MPDLNPRIVWENKQVRVVCLWKPYIRDLHPSCPELTDHRASLPGESPDMYRRQLVIEELAEPDAMLNPTWKKVTISATTHYLVKELAEAIANFKGIPDQVNVSKE